MSKHNKTNKDINIIYLGIYKWDSEKPIRISQIFNSSLFSIFTKSSISDLCSSITRYLVKSSPPGTQKNIICTEEMNYAYFTNNHTIFINTNQHGICYTILATKEYPDRLLLNLVSDADKEIEKSLSDNIIKCTHGDINIRLNDIEELIIFNKLLNNDKISQIDNDLDDIKNIMVENISSILETGEKLGTLIDKSEELEITSRRFVDDSKKLNSCCLIL